MPENKPNLILMAEDDDDFHRLTAFELRNHPDVELRRVEDGEELMDYLLHRGKYQNPQDAPSPDLIFLDLNMPRKNGHEALKEIRANAQLPFIPILILTVSSDRKDIQRAYSAGANSFITKPDDFREWSEFLKGVKHYWFEIVQLPTP